MVDKFGLMADDNSNVIIPIQRYAFNLDDLENVEGFNENGKKDGIYAFKLNEHGLYTRNEVVISQSGFQLDSKFGRVPVNLVYYNNKWNPIPTKHNWAVDIQLKPDKVITKGQNHIITKILNSGTMIGSLVPLDGYKEGTVLTRVGTKYFIGSSTDDGRIRRTVLRFNCEFDDDKKVLENFQNESTIIIEGKLLRAFNSKEIISGLKVTCKEDLRWTNFSIIIQYINKRHIIRTYPDKIEYEEPFKLGFKDILIWDNMYIIDRIRFTTTPVTDEEIQYC